MKTAEHKKCGVAVCYFGQHEGHYVNNVVHNTSSTAASALCHGELDEVRMRSVAEFALASIRGHDNRGAWRLKVDSCTRITCWRVNAFDAILVGHRVKGRGNPAILHPTKQLN